MSRLTTDTRNRKVVELHHCEARTRCMYLVEAAVENAFDLLLIKSGFLDLSSGVLVVECDCFAGS